MLRTAQSQWSTALCTLSPNNSTQGRLFKRVCPVSSLGKNEIWKTKKQSLILNLIPLGKEQRLLPRSQWREKGRMVDARDVDGLRKITTSGGTHLYLFSVEQ